MEEAPVDAALAGVQVQRSQAAREEEVLVDTAPAEV